MEIWKKRAEQLSDQFKAAGIKPSKVKILKTGMIQLTFGNKYILDVRVSSKGEIGGMMAIENVETEDLEFFKNPATLTEDVKRWILEQQELSAAVFIASLIY